jgi:sigma-B regulation protein RsbU (phosphoserine phosphatase)
MSFALGNAMPSDLEKTKEDLFQEITHLRRQAAEAEELRRSLEAVRQSCSKLEKRFQEQTEKFTRECTRRDQTAKALRMAEMIVDRSPVILFRRLAGENEKPTLVYVSENIRQFGYTAEEFLSGKVHFRDILHPDDTERLVAEIKAYAEKDVEEYTQYYRCLTKDGDVRWVEDQTSVVRNSAGVKTHNQGILFDITERKLAEDKLRKSEEKFRRIVETAGEGFMLMNEDLVIVEVNEAYCRLLGYTREELIGNPPLDPASGEFRRFIVEHQEAMLTKEYREFEGSLVTKEGRIVPVLIHGNTLRDDQGQVIGNMAFITDMTEHKKALALAGEVQKSLLPQEKPLVQGLDVAGKNVSCDEIGGDYYDFIWRRESKSGPFSVVVGDISGHGVDSALLMTTARAFLRMRASQPGNIAEIVAAMNQHLTRDVLESGRFMTLFYLTVDPLEDRLHWVRAGHEPALLYDPAGDHFVELKGSGVALGVDADSDFTQYSRQGISDGQIISIGTDGIWEAANTAGEMFGKDRFRNAIRQNARSGAAEIVNAVFNELNRFTKGRKPEDDITLVVIKIKR